MIASSMPNIGAMQHSMRQHEASTSGPGSSEVPHNKEMAAIGDKILQHLFQSLDTNLLAVSSIFDKAIVNNPAMKDDLLMVLGSIVSQQTGIKEFHSMLGSLNEVMVRNGIQLGGDQNTALLGFLTAEREAFAKGGGGGPGH